MDALNPDKALIFRITHASNLPWIIANGLHSQSSSIRDPNFQQIGNPDLIERRNHRRVPRPPGGTLGDYIPFYFTPYSPMLYNIKTGHAGVPKRTMEEIVFLLSSLPKVDADGHAWLFTDRHAYLQTANFYGSLDELDQVDWLLLRARNFKRDPEDPGSFERYQAEALIHEYMPASSLLGVVC